VSVPSASAPRREILAWAFYDFANSAFATTVLAVVFPLYFKDGLKAGPSAYGYILSAAMIISAVIAPILGAICDRAAAKKRALIVLWLVGCSGSMALFIPGTWPLAAAFFVVAMVGFEASSSIYNAFLPELAPGHNASRISSLGWAFGYLGGGLHLVLALMIIKHPEWFGLGTEAHLPVRAAIGSVGLWWLLFSLPLVFLLRERIVARPGIPGVSAIPEAVHKLKKTIQNVRRIPTLARYTIAFLLFNDGVQTVIAMSSTFGSEALGMKNDELIQCFLLIQGVAIVGSLSFAFLASKLKDKPALVVTLVIWIAVVSWAFFVKSSREFWYLGIAVGLVMGGTQAIARALQSRFTPPSSAAEFFGFYAITGKFASALGPAMFAGVTSLTGNVRWGVLSIAVLFVAGLIVLLPVDEARGEAEAGEEERRLTAAGPAP